MSLRARLAWTVGGFTLGGLLLGLLISYALLLRFALLEVDGSLRLQAEALLDLLDREGSLSLEVAEDILSGRYPAAAAVYREGRLVFQGGLSGAPWPFLSLRPGFRTLHGWRIYDREEGPWEVAVAQPLTAYRDLLGWYLRLGLPVALGLGLFAFLGAYALMGRALVPLRLLARAAERFEGAPFPPGRDEVGALARAFADLLARLRAERVREQAFLALASHELKTPVAALRAALEGLLARGGAGPKDLARLRDQALRVEALAENLLALSRAQTGEVAWTPVNLAEVLGSAFDRFQPLALRLGRELFLEAESLWVEADPRLLEQALNNLVYNALLHGKGRVFLRAYPLEEGAVLEVADEGSGLKPGAREGLGLRVVRAVAEVLGARLTLENAPGLRVRFTFPSAKGPLLGLEPEGSGR